MRPSIPIIKNARNFPIFFHYLQPSPFSTTAEVFRAGYTGNDRLNRLSGIRRGPREISLSSLDNVERALNRASSTEMTKLESALGFLATTGSAAPSSIGLFGTVWESWKPSNPSAREVQQTLPLSPPGISGSDRNGCRTARAAIPAVIFYNYFLNNQTMVQEMDNFADEFLNGVERYLIRK